MSALDDLIAKDSAAPLKGAAPVNADPLAALIARDSAMQGAGPTQSAAQPQAPQSSQGITDLLGGAPDMESAGITLNDAKNTAVGAFRGASRIGTTAMWPLDATGITGMTHAQRVASIDDFNKQHFNPDPDSPYFKIGDMGAQVAGTAGVGGALAAGAKAIPMLSRFAPVLESGGFKLGDSALPTSGQGIARNAVNMVGNGAQRAGAGAAVGGASAGMVDPDSAGTGALLGGAFPPLVSLAGLGGKALGVGARTVKDAIAPNIEDKAGDLLRSYTTRSLGNLAQPATPGVQFTLAQASGDPGLMALENAQRMKSNVPFVNLQTANNAALNAGLNRIAPVGKQAADDAVGSELRANLNEAKDHSKDLFTAVGQQARTIPPIVPTNTQQAAQQLLGQFPDLFDRPGLQDSAIKSRLTAITGSLEPTKTQPSVLLANGQKQAPTLTPQVAGWDDLNWLRQRVGNFLGRANQSAGAAGSAETQALGQLYGAVTKDQQSLVNSGGNPALADAWNQANQFHIGSLVPFKTGPLKNAVSNDMANAGAALVRPGAPNQSQLISAATNAQPNLTPALSDAFAARLADAARTGASDLGGNRVLSPSGLQNFMDSSSPLHSILLNPERQAAAKGLLGDMNTLNSGTNLRVKGGSDTTGQAAGLLDLVSGATKGLMANKVLTHLPLIGGLTDHLYEANQAKVLAAVNQGLLDPRYGMALLGRPGPARGQGLLSRLPLSAPAISGSAVAASNR